MIFYKYMRFLVGKSKNNGATDKELMNLKWELPPHFNIQTVHSLLNRTAFRVKAVRFNNG